MSANKFIGPVGDGLRKDLKSWATPDDSFDTLLNAYQFRGRIVRRPGYTTLGQLSFQITTQIVAASAQNFTNNLFTTFSLSGVVIVSGSITITVNGAANYVLSEDSSNPGTFIQTAGVGTDFLNGSINYLTGDLVLNFSVNPGGNVVISFSYAFMLPVMGLRTRELFELNEQDTIAFDTRFAYRYSNTLSLFQPLPSVMPVTWNGTNYQFFFTTNYAGAFWATNSNPGLNGIAISSINNANPAVVTTGVNHGYATGQSVTIINVEGYTPLVPTDPILNGQVFTITVTGLNTFSLDGFDGTLYTAYISGGMSLNSQVTVAGQDGIRYYATTSVGTTWVNYNPPIDPNNALAGCLLIFPYRGYLVFLNTTEGNETGTFNFGNRARWTQIGTPFYSPPDPTTPNPIGFDPFAVRDDLFGRGGANDAPTQEVIIGAGFIKDILIVFFERSTWRLRFVNNAQNPFIWERINVELGASATFSTIPFDKGLMAIGERGIVISDSNDTIRFDEKIPDSIFEIRIENQGMQRVNGIRTFRTKLNYWTYPDGENVNGTFPDKVLVFNYDTKNWSFFDDSFTCFGYFYSFDDRTWESLTEAWSNYGNITWQGSEIEKNYETVIAGNQQGFVFALEQTAAVNEESLYITDITTALGITTFTSPNNNIQDGTWVTLEGIAGVTDVTGVTLNGRNFKWINPSTPSAQPDTFNLQEFTPVDAGMTVLPSAFLYTLAEPFIPVFPGSPYITVGPETFTDTQLNGILIGSLGSAGTINYTTGSISLLFIAPIAATQVYIRVVSVNPNQGLSNVVTTGTYTGGGYITKISNFDIVTTIFNFLPDDKRSRLSYIDFYVDTTSDGEFTCNVFSDSGNTIINQPLSDNPRSNVVQTSLNPYQFGNGEETIFRLYADAIAQTIQCQFTMSDQQQAVNVISQSELEILGMNFNLRRGGRIV
jgi:hypothetical protein